MPFDGITDVMKQAAKLKGEFSFCVEKHYGGAVSMLGERPSDYPTKFRCTSLGT